MQRVRAGRTTTVPVPDHREVRGGTLASIIRQAGLGERTSSERPSHHRMSARCVAPPPSPAAKRQSAAGGSVFDYALEKVADKVERLTVFGGLDGVLNDTVRIGIKAD